MAHRGKNIAQLSVLIQSGHLDPRTLAEEMLDAIGNEGDQAIFVELTAARAMVEAEAASKRIAEGRSCGVLDGIPVAWKDLFDLEGMATTAGSTVLADDAPASRDADVVTALKQAGMICIGRTNMSELAFSGLGINPHYGTPRNPASKDGHRLPGGSSSGAGVTVAAGLVPVAIGTDTGGSVRIPAAFNGVVGYKASRGRYSMRGVYPLAKSLDSLGPLTHTVQDAVWVDAAMRGKAAADVQRAPLAGLSLVVPETVFFDGIEDGVAAAFEQAVERLVRAGAWVRRQAFPIFSELFDLIKEKGALVTAEAFALHKTRLEGADAARMDPRVVARTRLGANISMPDYIAIIEARERMTAAFSGMIGRQELLVSPTLPHVAAKVAPLLDDDDAFFAMNAKTLRNTQIGNFFDLCGVSIPCGTGEADMPVGLLLSGLHGSDDHVLSVAMAAEEIIRG
ncbi:MULTISPECIES: amidase [Agrobacterium tumefaciens complex]|uniref:Indoleacetamide hydrolase n=1 Tax=Agrobacterium radiobacter TaxID=362 RepID=A0ABR6J7G0_AGRRD|nr:MULTISPECIES: amidase [Agrobacterium tumefaciens complex]TGE79524.1 amidase [Rhizobium sp. SEMIA 439]KAA1234247.1 amidase [Agrobacterium tumefaciens]MBB4282064.1 aspartyl-tRNA(Asn)/glutamyl-tRNA(Gln) amidotransferase subunit A [Agrobacterium radiobacter]MBB4319336.1 aspartyl-tRNA(Asn)/glutamyl-tRNA(Gln) amidotransferase subunit A [Agrobacterium radiobacter]MBB4324603.1 aspartyl-tRNA(Asn)/glutamyl-tRNA(Gln) amidotransferase subunit A [Agrobacterium radiobacter]